MLPDWTVIGFSGHRHLADEPAVTRLITGALDDLAASCPSLLAVSSLATGSDTLFVREVAGRQIPFLLIFPFPDARFQEDFAPGEWQATAPLREQAAHIEEVHGPETDDEAYMEAGVRTVDQADLVLAVWDGQPAAGLGGTADVVAYARGVNKPLIWLNPLTGSVVQERIDQVHRAGAAREPSGKPRQAVEQHFQELDAAASREAPNVRHLIQRIVVLHLAATVAGLTTVALHIEGPVGYAFSLLEIVLLGTAFRLTANSHHAHLTWMQTRIEAELCRSSLATWSMRAHAGAGAAMAPAGLERLARNLDLSQKLDRDPGPPFASARHEYLEGRVRNQIDYFGRQKQRAQRSYLLLKRAAMLSTALATLLAAGHLVLSLVHAGGLAVGVTALLSLALPLVSTALLSLILTQEHARRAARYQEMVDLLEESARRVSAAPTWTGLARVAGETERALLNEVVEWHTFRRFASDPHQDIRGQR